MKSVFSDKWCRMMLFTIVIKQHQVHISFIEISVFNIVLQNFVPSLLMSNVNILTTQVWHVAHIIPRAQRSCWGVYWFHSVRSSVRPSVPRPSRIHSASHVHSVISYKTELILQVGNTGPISQFLGMVAWPNFENRYWQDQWHLSVSRSIYQWCWHSISLNI